MKESPLTARRRADQVTVRAPAKVNLHLSVGALRADGFHALTTVYQAVGLYDEVVLTATDGLSIEVRGEGAGVPADATNLAARAALLLAERTGRDPDVAIRLTKGIPVAGGCAGGSADAAAALLGCDALWGTGLGRDGLVELAAELGSDVPFALHGHTALGAGRGEQLTSVLAGGAFTWVLAVAGGGLSTPEVYRELDRLRAAGAPPSSAGGAEPVLAALRSGSAQHLGAALANDLQPAALALRPALEDDLARMQALGPLGLVVSGSGPTVALLARDEAHGAALARRLVAEGLCRQALAAPGPVAGARLTGAA